MKQMFFLICFAFFAASSQAQIISTVKGTSGLDGICVDDQGNITGYSVNTIYKYAPDGAIKLNCRGTIKPWTNKATGVTGPAGADKKGNVYYFDLVPAKGQFQLGLFRIDNNGKITSIWTEPNIVIGKISFQVSCGFVTNSGLPFGVNSLAVDNSGNTYFPQGNFILKIDGGGKLTRFAGGAIYYGDDAFSLKGNNGPASSAFIAKASHLKFDNQGNLYFLDGIGFMNNSTCIRKIDANGIISIVTDGRTMNNNPAQKVSPVISLINSFAIDNNGDLIITDKYCNNRIYKLTLSGMVSVIAGDGTCGYSGDGGPAATAKINRPDDVAVDGKGNIFFVDKGNWVVRKISNSGADNNAENTSCPIFSRIRQQAKDLYALADKFENDDIFYYSCVVDILLNGYNSPYAKYCLVISADMVPSYFKDNYSAEQIRPGLVKLIRSKAAVCQKLASVSVSKNYEQGIYSKETVATFCNPTFDKFTTDFWDALFQAGFVDYDLYQKTRDQIIIYGYKDWIERLDDGITIINLADGVGEAKIVITGAGKFVLSKTSIGTVKLLAKKELPAIVNSVEKNATSVEKVADDLIEWLGKDFKEPITNKAGDKVFMSKNGLRKVRFDINNSHGDAPHIHMQELKNGNWEDAVVGTHRIYPKN